MGLYVSSCYGNGNLLEGYKGNKKDRCPNMLIQIDKNYYLYNSNIAKVPGVNPVRFNNLEEYVEFVEFKRATGNICPVLYLQHSSEANGTDSYKIRPSPTNLLGGLSGVPASGLPSKPPPRNYVTPILDASRDQPPFNVNSYPGYNYNDTDQGDFTPSMMLDYITQSTGFSPNPMDSNWGGSDFTQALIDKGYFAGSEVKK